MFDTSRDQVTFSFTFSNDLDPTPDLLVRERLECLEKTGRDDKSLWGGICNVPGSSNCEG
jgi:hypothetical protein